MFDEDRPNPDALLKALQKEEMQQKRGKLKIFLGMAAGVGKTYAMLEEAQKALKEGIDVVVGTVNTHGRKETAALLENLKIIPEKKITYKDTVFEELDTDEILKLKPQLVIVDELAHSNVPGSRHSKRWQDVMEILEAGIDVYTTLNVQHIESYKDIIENITGISIRETVPDSIVDIANDIELVDITPTELLQRLKEGKVYLGPQSEVAARNFFQEDRLTALRELALRITAEKVDHDLHDMITTRDKPVSWKTRERLMVAVSSSPTSQHLIRTTRRLAFTLNAPWIALYVNDGHYLDEDAKAMLAKNLALARELGAEVITTYDPDIVQAIQRVARQRAITQIVIGRPLKRGIMEFFEGQSLLDRLAREISDIDVHVIRQGHLPLSYRQKKRSFKIPETLVSYLIAFCFILSITIVGKLFFWFVDYKFLGIIYLLGILLLGLFFKQSAVYFAGFISTLFWGYFFLPPAEEFYLKPQDYVILLIFFLTTILIGKLVHRARESQKMMLQREESAQAIYGILREIAGGPSTASVLKAVKERLGAILQGNCEILIKKIDDGLVFEPEMNILKDEKEQAVANWVFLNGKEAGWSTNTLSSVKALYLPLKGLHEVVGVLIYQPKTDKLLTTEEFNFLYTVCQQLANYIERSISEERTRKVENRNQIEKIYQTILKTISHEFHPPLESIQQSISYLKKESSVKNDEIGLTAVRKIENMSGNLMTIVENISTMAKLSSGVVPSQKKPQLIKDIIASSCEIVRPSLRYHELNIIIPDNLPLVDCDFHLIEFLLRNLIINAIDYSPPYTTIEIEAEVLGNYLILSVSDQGKGIPKDMLDHVFEKFYRGPGSRGKGIGLGLAIAKAIAKIHRGELKVQNRPEGGAKFSLVLPIAQPTFNP